MATIEELTAELADERGYSQNLEQALQKTKTENKSLKSTISRIEADRSRNFIEQQRVADANRESKNSEQQTKQTKHEKRVRQADYFAPEPAKQAEKDDYQCE